MSSCLCDLIKLALLYIDVLTLALLLFVQNNIPKSPGLGAAELDLAQARVVSKKLAGQCDLQFTTGRSYMTVPVGRVA